MMTELPETGRVRGKCVWWLSGQCKGGERCTCLPEQRHEPPDDEPDRPEPEPGQPDPPAG